MECQASTDRFGSVHSYFKFTNYYCVFILVGTQLDWFIHRQFSASRFLQSDRARRRYDFFEGRWVEKGWDSRLISGTTSFIDYSCYLSIIHQTAISLTPRSDWTGSVISEAEVLFAPLQSQKVCKIWFSWWALLPLVKRMRTAVSTLVQELQAACRHTVYDANAITVGCSKSQREASYAGDDSGPDKSYPSKRRKRENQEKPRTWETVCDAPKSAKTLRKGHNFHERSLSLVSLLPLFSPYSCCQKLQFFCPLWATRNMVLYGG